MNDGTGKNVRSKFNVANDTEARTFNEIVFDSEMEMKYYRDVVLPKYDAGEITEYELQKKYILQQSFKHNGKTVKPIEYIADFYLKYSDGTEKVIDIKGFQEPTAKLKRKLFWYKYPDIDYQWIAFSKLDGGWVSLEAIAKGRRERRKLRKDKKKN